jgi:hypothetical protein
MTEVKITVKKNSVTIQTVQSEVRTMVEKKFNTVRVQFKELDLVKQNKVRHIP